MKQSAAFALALVALTSMLISSWADDYTIKPGDTLAVTVLGEPDLTKRVVVDPKGNIVMPLISDVAVGGLSVQQAAGAIAEKLKALVKNPQVTVELAETAKLSVTVSGEVRSPGVYPLPGGSRLMEAISTAGGYLPTADLSKVTISHAGTSTPVTTIDLSKFLISGDAGMNVVLAAGDTVFVPASTTAAVGTVMILGAVRQAGQHPITTGMTLREAVMLAGGPTELADLSNLSLRHEGSSQNIIIDYAQTVQGVPAANPELKPGDVIYIAVKEQLGAYTIQGAVVSPGKYDLKGRTSLTEAIAIAGGVRDRAKLSDVRILRTTGGASETIRANVSDIMSGKAENPPIQNGDSIYVPAGKAKTDYLRILSLLVSIGWLLTRN